MTSISVGPWRRVLVAAGGVLLAASLSVASSAEASAKPAPTSKPRLNKPAAAPVKRAVSKPASAKSASSKVSIPDDVRKLGPLSVGDPHSGFLVNAVKMPSAPQWVLTVPSHGYATRETVDALGHCLRKVHGQFPGSPPVMLGSLSAEHGGLLPPHKSHRTGRDADVYFFRKPGARWVRAATKDDIDLPRTWAMLRCFMTDVDVDMVLIVRRVQSWLEEYALSVGEDPKWVQSLFHDPKPGYKSAPVRDVPGHVAHMHVRFSSPKARRAAVLAYDRLVRQGVVRSSVAQVQHQVVKGDTLSELAEKYDLSVERIRELNNLKSTVIRLGQKLVLQRAVDIPGARDPVYLPGRRKAPFDPPLRDEAAGALAGRDGAQRAYDAAVGDADAETTKPNDGERVNRDMPASEASPPKGERSDAASDNSAQPGRRANGWL